jgi:uncharacterized membrane protein
LSETRQAAMVIAAVLFIGLLGLLLTGGLPGVKAGLPADIVIAGKDVYVDDYSADLYLNGTLKESFIYNIDAADKYRMLYRSWTTLPVSLQNMSRPYVEPLEIIPPPGTIPYIKDQSGRVTVTAEDEASQADISEINSLAEINEAGCYMPQRFESGSYRIDYQFSIHPPLECDSEYCHWNLAFADKHLPYRQATITIHDPENLIVQLFPHMPFDVKKEGDAWIMTGSSPEDGLVEVEMLLRPEAAETIDGFPRQVSNVREKTLEAQQSKSSSNLLFALRALVLIFPFALALFYFKFGKEKQFTVPSTLSYVPHKRKPWLVNMVFRGDAFDFDEDGFYATLLDLHERGAIDIDSKAGLKIKLLKDEGTTDAEAAGNGFDDYERNVLSFLKEHSANGTFDPAAFEAEVKRLSSSRSRSSELKALHDRMDELLRNGDRDAASAFVSGRSLRVFGGSGIGYLFRIAFYIVFFAIFLGGLSLLANPVAATVFILLAQAAVPALAPSALFGRWKEDYYKEKLEWDAFRNFLSDFAMIKKYAPEDLGMWKEWLIYGTALGVGDKVREAMDDLNVSIPLAFAESGMRTYFAHAYSASAPRSSGSGGGGGFGGGGGSGGGGGGAR